MKFARIVLAVVLLGLVLVELYMCTALLPTRWQFTINDATNSILQHVRLHKYDYSLITHPAIDREIEQAWKENSGLRIMMYGVFAGLFIANGVAIVRLWYLLHQRKTATQT